MKHWDIIMQLRKALQALDDIKEDRKNPSDWYTSEYAAIRVDTSLRGTLTDLQNCNIKQEHI